MEQEVVENGTEIQVLTTDRLKLRGFELSDAADVQRLAGNPHVAAMTANVPHPYPDGAAEQWIELHRKRVSEKANFPWAVVDKQLGHLIGCISLGVSKRDNKAELGYWIGEEFWGKGLCTEASQEVIRWGFENLSLNKITSRHLAFNPASGRVMEKSGMTTEGYLKEESFLAGQYSDLVVYGLLRRDWVGAKS